MKLKLLIFLFLGWFGQLMAQTIQKVEYFIDTDPGFGSGTDIFITAGNTVTANLNIPLPTALSDGFHKFYVRAKNSDGVWSMVHTQNFFKTNELPSIQNIVKLEYFIDTDAGFGQGINIPISVNTNITQGLTIPLPSNLPVGFHQFFIRAQDASGKWSTVHTQNFFKTNDLPSIQNVVKLEYFIGVDPGFGLANAISVSSETTINLNNIIFAVDQHTPLGSNRLIVRAQDASGKWSIVGIKSFTNCPGVTIAAPQGLTSCTDSIRLVAQLQNSELGGSLKWFRNGVNLNITNDTLFAINSGTYSVERSTAGCLNIPSPPIDANILSSTFITLKTDKAGMFCNEQVTISIDSAQSVLPKGIPVLFDWFRDNTNIALNAASAFQNTTLAGTFKARMKVSLFPSGCQTFDSDSVTIENKNLTLNITPQTGSNALLLCTGSVASLLANQSLGENVSYQWFKDGQLLANETFTQLPIDNAPGTYVVKGSFLGCQDIASAGLVVSYAGNNNQVPTISAVQSLDVAYCGGEVLNFNATGCSNGVLWSFGETGNNVNFTVNTNTTVTASCVGSCLGSASNVLNVLGSGFAGFAPDISYALLPCSPDYTDIFRRDRVPTYGGVEAIQWKDFSGGGSLFGGNYTTSLFENIASGFGTKGGKDFMIRRNAHGGPYTYLFGGTADDALAGFAEISKNKYLVYGTTNSTNNGNISSVSFGQKDFWLFRWNFQTSQIEWQKRFGGSVDDVLVKTIRLSNGDFILAGYSASAAGGNKTAAKFGENDYWVIRIDSLGNKIWDKTYGGSGNETLTDVYQINNNQFALLGTSNSPISGNKTTAAYNGSKDYWLIWIDGNGNVVNQKQYGGDLDDVASKMVYNNTTLFLVGTSFSGISQDKTQANRGLSNTSDYWVVRVSESTGAVFWNKTLGSSATETAEASVLTMENNLVIWGSSNAQIANFEKLSAAKDQSSNPARIDGWLIEIDSDGNRITDYTLGGCTNDNIEPIAVLSRSGNVVVGIRASELCADPPLYSNNTLNYFDAPQLISFGKCQFTSTQPVCKNTQILVRMTPPQKINNLFNQFSDDLEDIEAYNWNNGQTNFYFETLTSDINNSFNVKYKLKDKACFSRLGDMPNLLYKDDLVLFGQVFSGATPTKQFAYESINSSQKILKKVDYRSEGNIELLSGFEVSASAAKVFKAEIGGCVND